MRTNMFEGFSPSAYLKKARYINSFLRRGLVHVNLQLLYSCNFRCQICDYWKPQYRDRPRLSLEQVKIIASKLNQVGPQIISIGGGEPLLHKEIVEIVASLAKWHFPVMICNGWYMTAPMARALFKAGMYEVSISVDYADAEKHDQQRGVKGAFDRAIEALRLLNENRTHSEQRVHMISVILDDNLDHIEPLIKIAREIGVTYLVTLYSDGRGTKACKPIDRDVSKYLLSLKKKYAEFVALRGYLGRFSEAIDNTGIGNCKCGLNLCNIDSQGNVSLCIDFVDDPIGNILTDEMPFLLKRLAQRNKSNSCKGCWTSCRGSIETMMYGHQRLPNLWDYYQLTKPMKSPPQML